MMDESKFIEDVEYYIKAIFMNLSKQYSKIIVERRAVELFKITLHDKFLINDENDSILRSIWDNFK